MRALADQISQSMERMSEIDLDDLAARYGVDAERARTLTDAAGKWLGDHLSGAGPLFGQPPIRDEDAPPPAGTPEAVAPGAPVADAAHRSSGPGPHPLDPATGRQGLALSALDSGRWAVRPGSNQLTGTGEGPPPPDADAAVDLVSDLRARDWITADGTLTLVGRHALARWCRATDDEAVGD